MPECRAEVLIEPQGTVEVVLETVIHEVVIEERVTEAEVTPTVHEVTVEPIETVVVEVSTVPPSVGFVPRVRQPLVGDIDGSNTVYTSALKFMHDGVRDEVLCYNGVEQDEGVGDDYVASESGGPGTGFDTITMSFAPRPGDKLWLNYYQV